MNCEKLKMGIVVPLLILLKLNLYAQVPDDVVAGGRIYEWFAAGKWRDIGEAPNDLFPPGTVHCDPANPTAVVDVFNPSTGKTWMDRNLGANQAATSKTDAAARGDYYQWGRLADGHQCRTSPTTSQLSSSDVPGHGDFIITFSLSDWRSPSNDNLWQGLNGVNNPCPTSYRVPTESELNAERLSWSTNNSNGAFASPLKLSLAGRRGSTNGITSDENFLSYYWSSTVSGTNSRYLRFSDFSAEMSGSFRAMGNSVRCIKEIEGEIGTLDCAGTEFVGEVVEGVTVNGVTVAVNYTDGNGGSYDSQSIESTGVLGLTATLAEGQFNVGAGNVVLEISGTALSTGVAVFVLDLGGQSCEIEIEVMGGEVNSLDCAGAEVAGEVVEGVEVNGVTVAVSYTGGNGGFYDSQSIESAGVLDLTATLVAGQFNVGAGNVVLEINGTALSTGVAVFVLDLGGQSCEIEIEVMGGEVNSLDCAGAEVSGEAIEGIELSGVTATVNYTGGNGGTYESQILLSTGVTGLTATLPLGTFAIGSGSLLYSITGTPSAAGTASFALSIGGQSCTLTISVGAPGPNYPPGTVHCDPDNPTALVDVLNPSTGKTWMDRNLGASQAATSITDAAAYGDLYQWGRLADGHQCRNSPTITERSSSDEPGHGDFIRTPSDPRDWRDPQNDNLWQGVNGVNNPCPAGYRLPTESELNAERLSWSTNNTAGAFASPLKLPGAGLRQPSDGSLSSVGTSSLCWSSTVSDNSAAFLTIGSAHASMSIGIRSIGLSVRCLKD
jgi:uncharacterized protein (TIGR02145 family)